MLGVVFTTLATVVEDVHGLAAWDSVLERAGVEGSYTTFDVYDDAQFEALAAAACELLDVDADTLLVDLGERYFPHLLTLMPSSADGHTSAFTYLQTIESVIHAEVRRHMAGAQVPVISTIRAEGDRIDLAYRSRRGLCRFAEGLVVGTGMQFGERCDVVHAACTRDGASQCELAVTVTAA